LAKAKCEVVQKNLTTDFLRLALSHQEEVTKLLEEHDALVRRMQTEMEAIAEPIVPAQLTGAAEAAEEDDDEETADEQESSILNVLNGTKFLYLVYKL
jgi:hypothetical protein